MTLTNYKKSLQASIFPIIAASAKELSIDNYVIGGYVRDLLLERGKSKDIDIVAVGSGIQLAKKVASKLKGKPKVYSKSVRAVHEFPASKHSKKPVEFRDLIIELCGDLPRLEMFARESAEGWDVFGNEAPNSILIDDKSPT